MKAARITEIDVWPVLFASGFRNTEDGVPTYKKLIDHATTYCTTTMQSFLFKNRARLATRIAGIWKWASVEGTWPSRG